MAWKSGVGFAGVCRPRVEKPLRNILILRRIENTMPESGQRLTPRAFLELKTPHSVHLSPDAKRAVFVVNEADFEESRWVSHLWLAEVSVARQALSTENPSSRNRQPATGDTTSDTQHRTPDSQRPASARARQITFSYEGERAPRWSPDGRWIAFLSARPDMTEPPPPSEEEEEQAHKEQLWILPVEGGEAQRLTTMKEGVRAFDWMPDSKTIVFLAPEPRPQPMQFVRDDARKRKVDPVVEHEEKFRQQFWEIGVEDRKPELLYTGDFGVAEFDIAPDGKQIVFNTNYTGEPNDYHAFDLFVLDMETGVARKLIERAGGKFQPQWSPDGTRIAFLANRDPSLSYSQECVWEVAAEGGEPVNLFADVPYDAHALLWARGDGALYVTVADRTNGPLMRVARGEIASVTAPGAALACSDFDVGAGGAVVATLEDDTTPPELYALEPGGEKCALTELNKAFRERYALPRQEVVRWKSDEWEIEGILVHPPECPLRTDPSHPITRSPNYPLPLVVQVHGGPKGRIANTLRSYYLHAVWASEGYLVLLPNFRGSEGYGNAFAIANRRDLGGGDFRDILAGVDYLIERGLADPNRLGIMGGSYGGYMTNWAIGQTDRFAAAISQFGIFNLITDFSNSEISRWDPDYLGAYYWEDPEIYRRCSPATYLHRIKTPVLILHGDSDNNTFISNSKEMYQALRARGATAQFVHYPREGHGLREPNHKLDEMRRCLAWFDRYLKGAGTAPPAYRVGDRIVHENYELCVLRADDAEYSGWHEEWGRLLEVAFSIASHDPVDAAWQFPVEEVRLTGPDGAACPLRGVPTDAGGGRTLVEGQSLTLNIHPDRDTGRIGFALAAAFQIPNEGGVFELRVANFPPVVFVLGRKEAKEEGEKAERHEAPEPEPTPSVPLPEEEGPIQTPQRKEAERRLFEPFSGHAPSLPAAARTVADVPAQRHIAENGNCPGEP